MYAMDILGCRVEDPCFSLSVPLLMAKGRVAPMGVHASGCQRKQKDGSGQSTASVLHTNQVGVATSQCRAKHIPPDFGHASSRRNSERSGSFKGSAKTSTASSLQAAGRGQSRRANSSSFASFRHWHALDSASSADSHGLIQVRVRDAEPMAAARHPNRGMPRGHHTNG